MTTTFFTVMLLKCLSNTWWRQIEQMLKEELNVFLKRVCTSARKKDSTLSVEKRPSIKGI